MRKYSKWDDVLECLIAVYCLREDGNFKAPQDVTQIFAQLHYHIRGATLYEAMLHLEDHDYDPYK